MPLTRTYDEPDVLFKLNPDGQSSISKVVLGKKAFEEAEAEGWIPIERLPKLPFPTGVYRKNGDVLRIENAAELEQALLPCTPECSPNCRKHNWERKVYAAPVKPEFMVASPGEPQIAATSAATVELALELVKANTRAAQQDQSIAELKAQNAQILELLASLKPKKPVAAEAK